MAQVMFFFFNAYFSDRERKKALTRKWERGRERERDRGSEVGSELTAESLRWGSNTQTMRS